MILSIAEEAGKIKQLMNDETYKEVVQHVKEQQTVVFLNPCSSLDEREDAHAIIRAFGKIEDYFATVLNDEKFSRK